MSTKENGGRAYHRAYANPTEDQAIANIMREESRKQSLVRRQKDKAHLSSKRKSPGGVRHVEE